jgi:hypothetical protein
MELEDAGRLTKVVFAAAGSRPGDDTARLYMDLFMELPDFVRAHEALYTVIRERQDGYLIPFGAIRTVYYGQALKQKYQRPELEEPGLTDEERERNIERVRVITDRIAGTIDLDEALARMEGLRA